MDNIVEVCEELPRRGGSKPAAYVIEHEKSGKFYVGSTGNAAQRKRGHLSDLRCGVNSNKELQDAFNDDPGLKFTFVLTPNREAAYDFEQKLLDHHKSDPRLCNTAPDARVPGKGMVRSEETRARISEVQIGKVSPLRGRTLSEEQRQKIVDTRERLRTPVVIDGVQYQSLSEAGQAMGVTASRIRKRILSPSDRFSNYSFCGGID